MSSTNQCGDVTRLLGAVRDGDAEAGNALFDLVYQQLRGLAHRQSKPHETLGTTGLVHEAYLKLVDGRTAVPEDRAHFFSTCALAMRHILVDRARARLRDKRGGGQAALPLDPDQTAGDARDALRIVALDRALEELAATSRRLAEITQLRYFGGLEAEEVARILDCSVPTVKRDSRTARAFLAERLGQW